MYRLLLRQEELQLKKLERLDVLLGILMNFNYLRTT